MKNWEVIRATGGYYFVTNGKEKFTFWGHEEGQFEARYLADFLNKQNKLIEKISLKATK